METVRMAVGKIPKGFWITSGVVGVAAMSLLFLAYPVYRTKGFRAAQSDRPVKCIIWLDRSNVEPSTDPTVTIENPEWLRSLSHSWGVAEHFRPNHPRTERRYYVKVVRESSRVDQYLVFVDSRGSEYDHFNVVNRSGNTTWYGSAFQAPDLRKLFDHPLLR